MVRGGWGIFDAGKNSKGIYKSRLLLISNFISVFLVMIVVFLSFSLCAGEDIKNCYEHPPDSTDWSFDATLQKFDSSRGDLTGAQIRINLTYEHNLSVSNRGDIPANISMSAGENFSLVLPDNKILRIESAKNWTAVLQPEKNAYFNESGAENRSFRLDPDQLSDFVGSSPDDLAILPVHITPFSSFLSDRTSSFDISSQVGVFICIIYEYNRTGSESEALVHNNGREIYE